MYEAAGKHYSNTISYNISDFIIPDNLFWQFL